LDRLDHALVGGAAADRRPPRDGAVCRRIDGGDVVRHRCACESERLARESLVPRVEEIEEEWSDEGDGWRLTGFRVDHEPVDQAFGFRLDADAGSIVISGDTRPSENLIRHALGADLLVHEVYWRRGAQALRALITDADELARRNTVDGYHTHSEDVGVIAQRAEVRHLILSHILFRGGTAADLQADIEPRYQGTLTVGNDLRAFPL